MTDIMLKIKELGELSKKGMYDECIKEINTIWQNLVDPKESSPNAYLLIEYAASISLKLDKLDDAWNWALLGLEFNNIRGDSGESEFLLGRIAYLKNDLELAKKHLMVAYKKSKGRAFKGEDPKYLALIKGVQ